VQAIAQQLGAMATKLSAAGQVAQATQLSAVATS